MAEDKGNFITEFISKWFKEPKKPQAIPEDSIVISPRVKNLFIQWFEECPSHDGGYTIYPKLERVSQADFDMIKAFAVIQAPYFPEWIAELGRKMYFVDPRACSLYFDISHTVADLLAQAASQDAGTRLSQLVDLFLDKSTQKTAAKAIESAFRYVSKRDFHRVLGPWIMAKPEAFPDFEGMLSFFDSTLLPIYKPIFASERDKYNTSLLPPISSRIFDYICNRNAQDYEDSRWIDEGLPEPEDHHTTIPFGLVSDAEFLELERYAIIQRDYFPDWIWGKALEVYKGDEREAGQYFEVPGIISSILAEGVLQDPKVRIPRIVELFRHQATRKTAANAILYCRLRIPEEVFHHSFGHLILTSPWEFPTFSVSIDGPGDARSEKYQQVIESWREVPRTVSSTWGE